jgi:hypothetical protein
MASLSMELRKEFGGHALAVHNHARDLTVPCVLFILLQKCGNTQGEMLVPAMGGDKQRMALLVVQQQERPAAQNHAQTPDQSAREEHLTVDRLAMAIHVAGQCMGVFSFSHFFRWGMPEVGGPRCQGIREAFCATGVSHLRQKGFRGAIAIGLCASGEQRQSIRHVPTQIPRARYSNRSQKQQSQQQASAHRCTACQGKRRWG